MAMKDDPFTTQPASVGSFFKCGNRTKMSNRPAELIVNIARCVFRKGSRDDGIQSGISSLVNTELSRHVFGKKYCISEMLFPETL